MQKRRAFGYHGKGKAHTSMQLKIKLLSTKEGKIEQIKAAGDETDDKCFDKGRYGPVNPLTSYCNLHLQDKLQASLINKHTYTQIHETR